MENRGYSVHERNYKGENNPNPCLDPILMPVLDWVMLGSL